MGSLHPSQSRYCTEGLDRYVPICLEIKGLLSAPPGARVTSPTLDSGRVVSNLRYMLVDDV